VRKTPLVLPLKFNRFGQAAIVAVAIWVSIAFSLRCSSAFAEGMPSFCRVKTASGALKFAGDDRDPLAIGKPVLLASEGRVSTGTVIYARLANFGKETIGYGPEFFIERQTGDGWELDSSSPRGPWPKKLGILPPESAGECYVFEVPRDQSTGEYRFSTKVRARLEERETAQLGALFRVVPFCSPHRKVRDYLKPLASLPALRGFPSEGRLRVGPPSLRIYPSTELKKQLVPIYRGKGSFLAYGQLEDAKRSSRRLDWWVSSRLERMDEHGIPTMLVRRKSQFIAKLRGFARRDFGFRERVAPGLYRLTIEIENRSGKKLDRYQEYFRAVPARWDLRLVADFTRLNLGETGYFRLENFGTLEAFFGAGYSLRNEIGEEVPIDAIFPAMLYRLPAGAADLCTLFSVPEGIPFGDYRIEVEVYRSQPWSPRRPSSPVSFPVRIGSDQ
jgi:hypothetical protein